MFDPSSYLFEELDGYASREEAEEVGAYLFDALFADDIGRSLERSRQFGDLNILLNIRPLELSLLPWELCFDKSEALFLALRKGQGFIRALDSMKASVKLALPENLRILHVYSTPLDMEPLSISKEALGTQGIITDLGNATATKLRIILSSAIFDVVHFDGHGLYDEDEELGFLFLQDKEGYAKPLSANVLGDYLSGTDVKLVVLSACESGRDGGNKRFSGVASHLMRSSSIPAVVSMQWPVTDESATIFNAEFYRGLSLGMPIEDALVFARWAIREQGRFAETFAPVLKMR